MELTGNDIIVTMQTLLVMFGAFSVIVSGTISITKMMSPFKTLKKQVEEHDARLKEGDKRFQSIEEHLEEDRKMQREICKSLMVIMNHEVTGNSVDKLKERQEELQQFLIDH
jgi:hypothetical protein